MVSIVACTGGEVDTSIHVAMFEFEIVIFQ